MEQNTLIILVATSYALFFAIVVAIFEVRLSILYKRHIDKIKPYGQRGIKRINGQLRFFVRIIFFLMILGSMASIYFLV